MMIKTKHKSVLRRVVALVGLCGLIAVPTTTWAQDDDFAAPEDTTLELGVDGPKTRALVAEDESIYVVQKRAYSKKGKFEITPFVFTAMNPKFVGYIGGGFSFAYHLRENFAVEFSTSIPYAIAPFYSALVYEVYTYETLTPEEVDLKQVEYFGALSAQFSALYGKFELYGILLDYDLYLTAGLGLTTTKEPCVPNTGDCGGAIGQYVNPTTGLLEGGLGFGLHTPEAGGDALKLSGHLGGGIRMFFTERLGVRIEIRDIVYADRKVGSTQSTSQGVTTDIRNTIFVFLGATVLL
jgi:outer membrane beta-barrel protein